MIDNDNNAMLNTLLSTYLTEESILPVLVLNSDRNFFMANQLFIDTILATNKIDSTQFQKNPHMYVKIDVLSHKSKIAYTCKKCNCQITNHSHRTTHYFCTIIETVDYCLIVFDDRRKENDKIITHMSNINVEMSNMTRELKKKNRQLEQVNAKVTALINIDSLTQIANRRSFYEALNQRISSLRSDHINFGIMMIDVDHFKIINDTYGHIVGDEILQQFAKLLKENIRSEDLVARIGGEEFCVIVSCDSINQLTRIAQKLRTIICNQNFKQLNQQITASFGISMYDHNENAVDLMQRADRALYHSKNNGRNKVSSF